MLVLDPRDFLLAAPFTCTHTQKDGPIAVDVDGKLARRATLFLDDRICPAFSHSLLLRRLWRPALTPTLFQSTLWRVCFFS